MYYWLHVFHVLLWGYQHIHNVHHLLRFYRRHHAIGFLYRSGLTSESPGSWWAALRLLIWLVFHGRSPVDW